MNANWVRRGVHLDVIIGVLIINIIGIPTQNQQENVVILINAYAKQKHVPNAPPIHTVKVVPIQCVNHAKAHI